VLLFFNLIKVIPIIIQDSCYNAYTYCMHFFANIFQRKPDTNPNKYVEGVVLWLLIIQTVLIALIYFQKIPKLQEEVSQAKNLSEQTLYRVGAVEQRIRK
jgi:hypothetical protein